MNRLQLQSRRASRRRYGAARLFPMGAILGVLLGLLAVIAGRPSPPALAQDTPGLQVVRSVSPEMGLIGDVEFDVNITLSGDPAACPGVTLSRPVDAVLVLDRSGSMIDSAGGGLTRLDLLKDATKTFARAMNLSTDRVAIVQFDSASNVVQSLTNDLQAIDRAIDSLVTAGGTAIDTGVIQGTWELQQRGDENSSQVLIVFTDGEQGSGGGLLGALLGLSSPEERAKEARAAGIRVITIGLGQSDSSNADMLRNMASSPDDAYMITDAGELRQVYQTIAQSVISQPVPATDIMLEHRFDGSAFELVPGSVRPQNAVVNANTISLSVPQLLEAPVALTYRVRPLAGGNAQIDLGDVLNYNLCGQTPQTVSLAEALPVVVQLPTATPTDTPTSTPTATPTIPPTLTPAPTWTPTATPDPAVVAAQRITNLRCDTGWLNWLFLLLLLLFMLWWLWKMWKEWKQNQNSDYYRGGRGCVCLLCPLLPWLFIPLTLLMLWALLGALDFCPERESLYYWRIDGSGGTGEIFVTDPQGYRPAQEFAAINEEDGCIGCHAVSSSARRIAAINGGGSGPIVVYDLDGEKIDIPDLSGSFVNWSPDGRLLAVGDINGDIQIVDIDTGQVSALRGASDSATFETMPAWSADGTTIAFVRGQRALTSYSITGGADIYVVPAGGGEPAPLPGASTGGFNYYPTYSPDGRWLAFTRHTNGTTTYSAPEAEIFLVPAAGGNPIRLAANDGDNGAPLVEPSNSWPTWSLDGTKLAFNSKRNDPGYDLFMTTIDENGNSGPAESVAGASVPNVFEHLPFWGLRPESDPLDAILGLWPFLLGYLLLGLLYWLCKKVDCVNQVPPPPPPLPDPPNPVEPVNLEALWQVAPTLLVGVGGTGRWVLTHLKKALADGGFGTLPDKVRFALLDTSERETTNHYEDAQGQVGVNFAGTSLDKDEVLLVGSNLSDLIGRANDAALAGWFPHDEYRRLGAHERDLANGTTQRRPMARAGLITKLREGATADHPPQDAARIWQFLIDNSRAVIDARDGNPNNPLVRVVLVGSMAGGMSGVLADLAGLLRAAATKAMPEGGTVNLEGYFTTEGPYHQQVNNANTSVTLNINTAATARELQRFQLSAGLPTVIDYTADGRPDEQAEPLRQTHKVKLFDEVVLFGQDGNYDTEEGRSSEPWATTLASMADVLALRLDRAAAAGTGGDHRAALRNRVDATQQHRNDAIVSSAGSYSLRLPLVDMLHVVHTRWAHNLYRVFLMGDVNATEPDFSPEQAGLGRPYDKAQIFLGGGVAGAPAGISAAGALANGQTALPSRVRALAEAHDDAYRAFLSRTLSEYLNGTQGARRLHRRAPQLGFAVVFTAEVAKLLGEAANRARSMAATAPEHNATGGLVNTIRNWLDMGTTPAADWNAAATRLAAWREITMHSHDSLQGVLKLISHDPKRDADGKPVIPGLGDELNRRRVEAESRRAQMNKVAVRRYLWSRPINPDRNPADPKNQQDLVEEWTTAANQQLNQYLDRLLWQNMPDGTVRLSLIAYDAKHPIRLDDRDPQTVRLLADELIRLAADVTRQTAGSVRLADVLPTQLSSRHTHPERELILSMWPVAKPSVEPGIAAGRLVDDVHTEVAVGIPDHVLLDPQLENLKQSFGALRELFAGDDQPARVSVIRATDKTALTLARTNELMPLFGLPEMDNAWKDYAQNAGTDVLNDTHPTDQAHVFRAEREALEYERRLESPSVLNQTFRRLHPLLVHSLQRPDIVEAFALGVAAGWITVRTLENNEKEVALQLPDGNRMVLEKAQGAYSPLIAALLQAVAGWDDNTPARQQLRAAIDNPNAATLQAWQGFIDAVRQAPVQAPPRPQKRCQQNGHTMGDEDNFCEICGSPAAPMPPAPPPVRRPKPFANEPDSAVQDLVAVATLAAWRKRLQNPAHWDGIVMRASKLFQR